MVCPLLQVNEQLFATSQALRWRRKLLANYICQMRNSPDKRPLTDLFIPCYMTTTCITITFPLTPYFRGFGSILHLHLRSEFQPESSAPASPQRTEAQRYKTQKGSKQQWLVQEEACAKWGILDTASGPGQQISVFPTRAGADHAVSPFLCSPPIFIYWLLQLDCKLFGSGAALQFCLYSM